MYEAYFVNINTGELFRSGSPKNNKCECFYPEFNVEGWSRVRWSMYKLLDNVRGFGFCEGVEKA